MILNPKKYVLTIIEFVIFRVNVIFVLPFKQLQTPYSGFYSGNIVRCGHFEFEMFTDKNCSILGTIVSKTVYRGSSEVASGGVL